MSLHDEIKIMAVSPNLMYDKCDLFWQKLEKNHASVIQKKKPQLMFQVQQIS